MAVSTGFAIATIAGAIIGGTAIDQGMDSMEDRAEKKAKEQADALRRSMVKPLEMPRLDDKRIRDARNMRLLQLSQRSGRESTFLSQRGGTGSNNKMGG